MTTKLHDLEKKEQDLREQMGVGGGGGGNESTNHPAPIGPTTSFSNRNNEQDNNFIAQSLQSGGEEGLSPRSPFKSVIRAYLPNQQRTSVQVHYLYNYITVHSIIIYYTSCDSCRYELQNAI